MPKFTAVRSDHSYVDAHGITIHYYAWKAAKPRGVVQICHGLGEHAGRYEYLAQKLVAEGYSVYADDHRGHGKTGMEQYADDHTRLGKLGPGGMRAVFEGVHQFTGLIKQENPGLPIVFLGQSWGSIIIQTILNTHAKDYDAVVLTGTAHRLPHRMNPGDLNAKHKHLGTTGFEWLSRDPLVAQAFVDDPLTFYADALKLFGPIDGLRVYGAPARKFGKDLPLLIMIGSEDSLGGERSVRGLAQAYLRRSKLTDVQVIIYDEARHEVFNETNREEVIGDLVAWLDERVGRSGGMSGDGGI